MITLDLTDEEAAALAKHLRQAIDEARHPLAPRFTDILRNRRSTYLRAPRAILYLHRYPERV